MRATSFAVLLIFVASIACAQTSLVGVGASFNSAVIPAVNGIVFVARDLNTGADLKTYSFTSIHITSVKPKPFTVETSTSTGIAQQLWKRDRLTILVPGTVGVAAGGSNVGLSLSGGVLADYDLKRDGWHLVGGFQATRTTLSGYQPNIGLTFAKEF